MPERSAEHLLQRWRPYDARRLTRRERRIEHERLDRAIDRVGEAFASKLDRGALADIVVRTARVTVSVGISAMWPGSGDPAALVEAADLGLYAAKRTGKNRVRSGGWATGGPGDEAERRFARASLASDRASGDR